MELWFAEPSVQVAAYPSDFEPALPHSSLRVPAPSTLSTLFSSSIEMDSAPTDTGSGRWPHCVHLSVPPAPVQRHPPLISAFVR